MSSSILDPSVLTSKLPKLLPKEDHALKSAQDGLAALVHTAMTVLGFRLVGVEDSSSQGIYEDNVLPSGWNANGPGHYTLRYKHEQSSLEFVLKLAKLGTRFTINAIAVETDKVASLDIAANDFTSPSFYPHDPNATDASPLVHGFISSNRVTDFMSQFQPMIVQKLIPGLRKEGYTEQAEPATARAGPSNQPPPARPQPIFPQQGPGEGDPLRVPPRNPLEIGRSDREPFPHNPFAPPPLFPSNGGDGMFVGPDHPIFGPGMGGRGGRGPWGGDGFLPPMGAPPGARFDPVGPGLGPFPGPIPGRGRGGMPGGGNMRDPDFDDFPPPGSGHDNMYM
ncbi:proteasome inhibitor PI31 subunit [Phanerochaete sordida]|uniref:Proteasome inhibitor PI31 subunit n=1 Tax=Phanerochaete sordida TaxID=48140 RepID=A0A9P3FWM5_9APHY|nr:proteasome inhibitor PI31 subunit [Phanerochaete sordida]